MAAGTADTPRVTVAMITHGVPGNAFWDLFRKGAETAAAKDNIELRYSADPESPNAMAPAVKAALAAGIPVVGLNAGFDIWKSLGVQQYFGQDEASSGGPRDASRPTAPRRGCASSTSRATSHSNRVAQESHRGSRASLNSSTSTARTCRRSRRP